MSPMPWLFIVSLVVLCAGSPALATDVPIIGLKLIVVDKLAAAGKAKAVFVAKDTGVTKGSGTNPAQIEATLDVAYDTASGQFVMAQGSDWLVNSSTVAKYVNKFAPTGGPVKVSVIKPGLLVKVVGKSLGSPALDVSSPPSGVLYVADTIVNGGDETRLCTQFTGCVHKPIAGNTGYKLVCKGNSSGDPTCSAVTTTTTSTSSSSTTSTSSTTSSTTSTSTSTSTSTTTSTSTSTTTSTSTSSTTSTTVPFCGMFLTKWGTSGTNPGQFDALGGVAVDGNGDVYTVEAGINRIQKFTNNGAFILQWGSAGTADGQFDGYARAIAVDPSDGTVYVVDNTRIQKFTNTGGFLLKFGIGTTYEPNGVSVDGLGNVWVTEGCCGNGAIRRYTTGGTLLNSWGLPGSKPSSGGIVADGSGNIWVAAQVSFQNRVRLYTNTGGLLTEWDPGPGGQAGIARNAAGDIFVINSTGIFVKRFTSTGTLLDQFGSTGIGDGQFGFPDWVGLAVDASGNVFVPDNTNHRMQKFACP